MYSQENLIGHVPTKLICYVSKIDRQKFLPRTVEEIEQCRAHILNTPELLNGILQASANCPNLHQLLHVLPSEEGETVFWYELLKDRISLRTFIEINSLTAVETVELFAQIFAGPHALHLQRILHRDIKPENYVVENGLVMLTDYEFADLLGQAPAVIEMGTPNFMANEAREPNYQSEPQTDVYSLGKTVLDILFIIWDRLEITSSHRSHGLKMLNTVNGNDDIDIVAKLACLEDCGFPRTAKAVLKSVYFDKQARYTSVAEFARFFVAAYISDLNKLGLMN